ncbi:MAG TPA: 23S rRNA (adenine(2503)-C(2))-methyltransferase RlmN, partial [Hyalangium sp.]|nr:23S rRNA (adenine(2503)-C(2))-methyltransferase RlmN [Hyalangium sp.]
MSEPSVTTPDTTPLPAPVPTKLVDVSSLTLEGLTRFVTEQLGERAFRTGQIYRWIHQRGVTSFDEMTDLSKALRQKLKERAEIVPLVKDLEQRSVDGTIKYRFKTRDGRYIESVYMPSEDRKTLCVSTQVGCAMACSFCMTGTLGLKRNLTPGEIVAQVHTVNREVRQLTGLETYRPLTNLVFMGMGEPLHNLDHVHRAITVLCHPGGAGLSPWRITVSTAGLVSGLERLARMSPRPQLAVSLNATTDALRSSLMPVNRAWNLARLRQALDAWPLKSQERFTFEYVLLAGENDT